MSAKAIRYYLMQDTVSGSASTVSTDNPNLWPTAADVPDYAYKSLGNLWLSSATPVSSQLGDSIVYRFGQNDTATNEISIFTQPIESVISDTMRDNTIGAEESNLVIRITKTATSSSSVDLIQNIELRLRYLLDINWRRRRRGTPPFIPSTGDKSLDSAVGVLCEWDGYVTMPNAIQTIVRYKTYYVRGVPRAT